MLILRFICILYLFSLTEDNKEESWGLIKELQRSQLQGLFDLV